MSLVEDINNTTSKATSIGERYVKTSHQYLKLKIFQQLTISLSLVAKVLAIGSFFFVGVVFCSIAAAITIGNLLESLALGYLVVGGIYVVVAIILYSLRQKINQLIIEKTSKSYFN